MQQIIKTMLARYDARTAIEKVNALKETIQEAVLLGLYRGGFFKEAAFYGGTALRIFYGLNRFSEDLDFSLIKPNPKFDITKYFSILEDELNSLGLKFMIQEKNKSNDSNIKSAFLKGGTKENILLFYSENDDIIHYHSKEQIKIKFEVDVNPPQFATFDIKYKTLPSLYHARLYDQPSLFAGKLHALICRGWKNRIKGRDLYDYLFYIGMGVKVNIPHLKARLVDSDYFDDTENFNIEILHQILNERFSQIDYNQAKEDVIPFIKDKRELHEWCQELFKSTVLGIGASE